MLARDERAHLGRGIEAVPDLHVGEALLDRADERVGCIADSDDDRDGHAALSGGAVAGADGRVCGHVDVGIGEHDHVVLGAAERLHALPGLRARLVHVARDRGRADEAHRGDVRVCEDRVDGDLVALHDVEDAVRETGLLAAAPPCRSEADGSFSDGLSTNAFPQAIAGAHIHMGTIAGKLNGVIPATTPSGCRIE